MRRAFVLLGLLLLMGCGNRPKPPLLLHGIYLSPENLGKISMKVPEDWELREGLERVPLIALSPVREGQTFRENLTLVTVPLQEGETGAQFVTRSLDEASKQVTGYKPLPTTDPEHWGFYQHEYGGQTIDVMAYCRTLDKTGYIFAFSCGVADGGEARKMFEAIAQTISVEPEAYAQMKDLRDTLQKHDEVVYDIKMGHKK